ncbi:MAG: sigma-54-dependent Fis family transcriptional regulator [Firmicutes bacterium]|nr:sigma-54-dependent Fis family transcriptional regulator [Bacillota bacterium]
MKIMLIDDDRDSRTSIGEFIVDLGHQVRVCENGIEALEVFAREHFPMVLSDIKMPHMNGLELLKSITALPSGSDTDVVLFTGHGDVESAVAALRAGAYDYLLKPINVEELALIIERIAERRAMLQENRILTENFNNELESATKEMREELSHLRKMAAHYIGLDEIGVFSAEMKHVVQQANRYHTDRSIPVLIEGETGTGKELVAKIIHYGNLENPTPFVDINCAALTSNLFESELFGYEAGAFTGGLVKGQKGKLDLAQGGTLFLDEVGEIPLELQGKLLRVIQEREYYRVGGLKKVKTDVRIICSTNVNLEAAVEKGAFRKDLYYRLKVGHLRLPPLRQRPEEILPLANIFLKEMTRQRGKRFKRIGRAASELLAAHAWPGNVRELRNLIEWAVFMYDEEELKPIHLKGLGAGRPAAVETVSERMNQIEPMNFTLPPGGLSLEEYNNRIIDRALKMHRGNKTETARYLGISRRSLYSRLKYLEGYKESV